MTVPQLLRAALATALSLATPPGEALADPAAIEDVALARHGAGWRADVTLRHADTGWDDYADGWRLETEAGAIIAERALLHPHVEEQPFTRSVSGFGIPRGATAVIVRARTSVEGWAETGVRIAVPRD